MVSIAGFHRAALVSAAALLAAPAPARTQEPLPAETVKLLRTFNEEFVEIRPGTGEFPATFSMGTEGGRREERPAHEVKLAGPFFMAKYEVPQNLYEAVAGANPSRWKGPRNSAEMFSWNDATAFCAKATAMMRQAKLIGDDELIRLPTEAEWEYCCRAGSTTAYSFGDEAQAPGDKGRQATLLDPYGWHTGNAAGNDPPVGALKANAWGLYDMHGYLREFVADHWHPNYEGAPRTSAAWIDADETYSLRVVRGGSWRDWHGDLRSAARMPVPADACSDAIGLRCVKSKR